MDLESLRCFVAVAEALHFRAAAERVSLSPAALSDRVRRLEEDIGAPLFERTTRKVHLTDAGRRLLPHARQLLDEAARCRGVALGDPRPLPFALTLGTRYELGISWLCPSLPILEAARPERTLHLYMGDTSALLDRLERGTVDACVLSARITRANVESVPLHEEAYTFVAATPIAPEALGDQVLVDATPDLQLFRYLLDALPEGAPWRFRGHRYVGGIAAIRQQVLAGRGVAVLPRYFIADDVAAGRLATLLPEVEPRRDWFRLLWRSGHPREAELFVLAEALRALPLR
ncbi:MAG: LysR family transcriptional regulator [Pseudomonadota bacterium]|nr:LysR family transcriptional regulator [Pseudomonadota bacterium]